MHDKRPRVLIVDDEQAVCDLLYDELSERGYLCTTALNGKDALTELTTDEFDMVLLDIKMPGASGIDVLSKISSDHLNTATIMITAVNDVNTAVEVMKLGASDYIVKPFDLDRVIAAMHTVLDTKKCSTKTRGCKTLLNVAHEEDQAGAKSLRRVNAIARGVEARLDSLFGYSNMVTQRTIEIAQQLDIAEDEIESWAMAREALDSDRKRLITSILGKLEQSPFLQSIIGMTELYVCPPKFNES